MGKAKLGAGDDEFVSGFPLGSSSSSRRRRFLGTLDKERGRELPAFAPSPVTPGLDSRPESTGCAGSWNPAGAARHPRSQTEKRDLGWLIPFTPPPEQILRELCPSSTWEWPRSFLVFQPRKAQLSCRSLPAFPRRFRLNPRAQLGILGSHDFIPQRWVLCHFTRKHRLGWAELAWVRPSWKLSPAQLLAQPPFLTSSPGMGREPEWSFVC